MDLALSPSHQSPTDSAEEAKFLFSLGLTEYARIAEGRFVDEVSSKLEALRKRLAQKMCFVR